MGKEDSKINILFCAHYIDLNPSNSKNNWILKKQNFYYNSSGYIKK